MPKNNISILFWLYKAKQNNQGLKPLYLRITCNGKRKQVATGYFLTQEKWDAAKGKVKGISQETKEINQYIQSTRTKLISIYNLMLSNGDTNLDTLVQQFFGRDINQMTLLELIKYHNDDFYKRIDVDYSYSTFEKYDILRKRVETFIPFKYHKKDIRLKDVTLSFAADFDFYLKQENKNEHNTASKYIRNLKKIFNLAVSNGWLKDNPIAKFKATYKEVNRIYLTQAELDILEQKSFRLERLHLVRDLFLFQCYTGLAYCDMAKLKASDISLGIDGNKWIITNRKKTESRTVIPLLPKAIEVIERYKNTSNTEFLLPCYAIQKFNVYLHEIAEVCHISKNLSSHVGRRTFATTIALANGISLETISKILGHKSTKLTHQYAVVTDHKVSEEMQILRQKLQATKNPIKTTKSGYG